MLLLDLKFLEKCVLWLHTLIVNSKNSYFYNIYWNSLIPQWNTIFWMEEFFLILEGCFCYVEIFLEIWRNLWFSFLFFDVFWWLCCKVFCFQLIIVFSGGIFCSIIVWLRIFFDEEMFGWDFYDEVFLMTNFFLLKIIPKNVLLLKIFFFIKELYKLFL